MATRNNGSAAGYQWVDANPVAGNNYYRISSVDINGKVLYSKVVKVFMGKSDPQIMVYPNPVTEGNINLQLVNQPKGTYAIKLINKLGQVMMTKQIKHDEGSSTESMQIDKTRGWTADSFQKGTMGSRYVPDDRCRQETGE